MNPALRDSRYVERIVHELGQLRALTLDHLDGDSRVCVVHQHARQQLARITDTREWIMQLVAKEREKFVLAAIGFAERFLASWPRRVR